MCNSKKSKFFKEQEAKGLLNSLGIKIPLLGNILFYRYKINEIVSKFLLARYKFIPEMRLKQPRFMDSSCGLFTKNKERIQKLKKTQKIQDIFTEANQTKLVFNVIWLMEILKI